MKFKQLLDDVLDQFPKVGVRADQDPHATAFHGKLNTMSQYYHHTRDDGAKHMADYEDPDSTQFAFGTLLGGKNKIL